MVIHLFVKSKHDHPYSSKMRLVYLRMDPFWSWSASLGLLIKLIINTFEQAATKGMFNWHENNINENIIL